MAEISSNGFSLFKLPTSGLMRSNCTRWFLTCVLWAVLL